MMENAHENQQEVKTVSQTDLLRRGLKSMQKVLGQEVKVTREDMMNLLNFEVVVSGIIASMDALEGKSPEEVIAMYANAKKTAS
jgi:hypothetical protein